MEKKIYLVLQNGKVFEGVSFGACRETVGEVVFTTGMTGYLETLTDPSYYGQIVVQTFPLIGNYGVIPADFESERPALRAYVVHELCGSPSNFRAQGTLNEYFKENGIIGISGVDTRELTKTIREYGVMNAKIVFAENLNRVDFEQVKSYKITDAVKSVTRESTVVKAQSERYHVILWDFGAMNYIANELLKHGCTVTTVPAGATFKQISELKPDGVVLSNGPGDPAENADIVKEIAKLLKTDIPVFGIGLGHQLAALASGAKTERLKYGHRGANQPVKNTDNDRVFNSAQNHGYVVAAKSLPRHARISFINVNDDTVEGIEYGGKPVFTVQFEAAGSPETRSLFDQFVENMKEGM